MVEKTNGQLNENDDWFDDYALEEEENYPLSDYDLTATPNDFNILTIYQFIESGAVKIPNFQRNYVWDIRRASKLIESLLMGLPVPQVFLYERARNEFYVIDGQQRLMSIYYFIKQRFPRREQRFESRKIFDERGSIPEEVLFNDSYFTPFRLSLPGTLPDQHNKFHGLYYASLGEYKAQFDLRPIRNVIIRPGTPDDDSAMYEIFSRLNSGGVNLRPQEIRTSLYHSQFYDMLHRINLYPEGRRLVGKNEPDLHMKDVEILLRSFAMLIEGTNYAPSMVRFLNQFSKKAQTQSIEQNEYLKELFHSFLAASTKLETNTFLSKRTRRFNFALFESVFAAVCKEPFLQRKLISNPLDQERIGRLESDKEFTRASLEGTTQTANVKNRLDMASAIVGNA